MPSNINSIHLEECSANELLDIISELKNGKSSDISIHVIQKAAHVLCPLLSERDKRSRVSFRENQECPEIGKYYLDCCFILKNVFTRFE